MRHHVLDDTRRMSSYFKEVTNSGKPLWTTDNTSLSMLTCWVSPDVQVYAIAVGSSFCDSEDKTEEFVEIVGALAQAMDVELPRNWRR